jgi:hypothetical protein
MIGDARGIVVATTHQALRQALLEAGALVAPSVAEVEGAITSGAAVAILASQEFPGLDPERVEAWAVQGLPVLLWIEQDPPPSWARTSAVAETVVGEIADEDINRWMASIALADDLAPEARIHGILGLGRPVAELAWQWSARLGQRRGPGLLVDADWSGGGLTEMLAAHVWGRVWDFGGGHPLPLSAGQLLPAPPPWAIGGDERGTVGEGDLISTVPWAVVDLGGDFRRQPALSWIARLDVVVIDGYGHAPLRVRETLLSIRSLNPGAVLGYRGDDAVGLPEVVKLGELWPRMPQASSKTLPRRRRLGRVLLARIRGALK